MTEKKARNQGKPHIENQVLERNRGSGEKGERGPEPYIETRKLQAQGARVLDGMCMPVPLQRYNEPGDGKAGQETILRGSSVLMLPKSVPSLRKHAVSWQLSCIPLPLR